MKKSILVLGLSVFALGAYATTAVANTNNIVSIVNDGDKKVEIEAAKLPENVAKAVADAGKDLKVSKAFQLVNAENKVTGYEVILLAADKKEQTLKFDAAGALVK